MIPDEQDRLLPVFSGVLLRRFEAADAEAAAEIEYDPVVKQYLGKPTKPRNKWIEEFPSKMQGNWSFAVIAQPENVLAGRASLHLRSLDPITTKTEMNQKRELEIIIASAFLGRRFGRLVAHALIPIAFDVLGA